MIITRLNGGLGNQMFQYALGRSLSLFHNTHLLVDLGEYFDGSYKKYELGNFNVDAKTAKQPTLIKYRLDLGKAGLLTNSLFRSAIFPIYYNNVIKEKDRFLFDKSIYERTPPKLLVGYWQNEKYFVKCQKILFEELSLKVESIKYKIAKKYVKQHNPSVSIHVRRGDYIKLNNINYYNPPTTLYYMKAVKFIKSKVSKPKFIIFTDDVVWCRKNLKLDALYSADFKLTDAEELMLMSKCAHNIIANSSFSWWGAWLNQSNEAIVITPKQWFKDKNNNSSNIICTDWVKI
jgi:hypothetical protein